MHRKKERKGMAVVLPPALIERSIYIRELVDRLQADSNELLQLVQEERERERQHGRPN